VTDVQRAAYGRGRRVDPEQALGRRVGIEAERAAALPHPAPLVLDPIERRPLGDAGDRARAVARGLLLAVSGGR
jgi:hypothetical protein